MGFKLFVRMQNDFVLTERGRVFYEEILPYHEKMTVIEKSYKNSKWNNRERHDLRVGTELFSQSMINRFMDRFKRNKNIKHVFYFECCKESALEKLLAEDIELLFSHRIINHDHVSFIELNSEQMCLLFCSDLELEIFNKSINTVFIIEQRTVDQDNLNKISTYICSSFPNADILIVNSLLTYLDLIGSGKAVGIVDEMFTSTHKEDKHTLFLPSINKMKINVSLTTHIYFLKRNKYISKRLADMV